MAYSSVLLSSPVTQRKKPTREEHGYKCSYPAGLLRIQPPPHGSCRLFSLPNLFVNFTDFRLQHKDGRGQVARLRAARRTQCVLSTANS